MAAAATDAHKTLADLFEKARKAASQRPAGGAAAVIHFVLDDDTWVVDTRPNTPAQQVVRRLGDSPERSAAPDVVVTLDTETLCALLDGSLPPLRAWTQKRIHVSGNYKHLRALEWLSTVTEGKPRGAAGGARVLVRSANGDAGHGEYELVVSEEAACWTVWRRWSDLKLLAAALVVEYGTSTPYNLALPALKSHALRASGSSALLRARQRQMGAYLTTVLELLPTSPRTAMGPAPLLRFLDAEAFERAPIVGSWSDGLRPSMASSDGLDTDGCVALTPTTVSLLAPPPDRPVSLRPPRQMRASSREEAAGEEAPLLPGGAAPCSDAPARMQPRHAIAPKAPPPPSTLPAPSLEEGAAAMQPVTQLWVMAQLEEQATELDRLRASLHHTHLAAAVALGLVLVAACVSFVAPQVPATLAAALTPTSMAARIALAGVVLPAALGYAYLAIRRPTELQLFARAARVSSLFAAIFFRYKLTSFRSRRLKRRARAAASRPGGAGDVASDKLHVQDEALWAAHHERVGQLLHGHMVALGGLWVKIGQYIASRSDLISPAIVHHLSRMLDKNPPRSLSEVVRTLLNELGPDVAERVCSIDPTPLSTASIAQVHAARLANGAKVVIKFQHAEVARVMRQDMRQALLLGRLLAFFEPDFDFVSLLREANGEHEKELDFTIEAANLADVKANLQRARVVAEVPAPVSGLVTERLLVMTFSEGVSLKDRDVLLAEGIELELLVARVCEAWASQMLTDGVFNADPHAGNLLCRLEPGVGPLPVLLDFGLCKRLSADATRRFCQLVHGLSEADGDLVMESLVGLGLRLNVELEPFEFLAWLAFNFRQTDGDADAARRRTKAVMKQEMQRDEVYRKSKQAAGKRLKRDGGRPQKEQLPPEIIYFIRTIDMLQGLCTRLGVSYPFLKPMAVCAQQALLKHSRRQLQWAGGGASPASDLAAAPLVAPPPPPRALLGGADTQQRCSQMLSAFATTGELLGAQVCLYVHGRAVVDAAAGTLGAVDARPVTPSSLFQLFQAGAPLLAVLVLQHAARGRLSPDATVASAWPAFSATALSVGALLAHSSGLASALPRAARLRQLLELPAMVALLAAAAAAASSGSGSAAGEAEYEGAPWGWAVAGLLRALDDHAAATGPTRGDGRASDAAGANGRGSGGGGGGGWSLESRLEEGITRRLGVSSELRLSLTDDMGRERAARHSMSLMMRQMGVELSDMLGAPPPPSGEVDGAKAADGDGGGSAAAAAEVPGITVVGSEADAYANSANDGVNWERFQGAQQLKSPATLNSAQLRTACVPGVSSHGSARALAKFYASLCADRSAPSTQLLPPAMLAQAAQARAKGSLNGANASWGLGFQLGQVVDASGRAHVLLGHLGIGGVVGLCVPSCGVALAVTVSQLSAHWTPTKRLVDLLLRGCGLTIQPGFFPS